jgi:hypothetical protein
MQRRRSILQAVGTTLGAGLLGSQLAGATPTQVDETPFSDVPQDHWAYTPITELASEGVIAGYGDGTFRPDQQVTRAEFAALLNQAYDLTLPPSYDSEASPQFPDVPQDFWARPAIASAAEAGFLAGYPDGTFRPNQGIEREEVLAALQNDPEFPADEPIDPERYIGGLLDVDEGDWSFEVVARMSKYDKLYNDLYLYYGVDYRYFYPQLEASRAEVANFVYNMLADPRPAGEFMSGDYVRPTSQVTLRDFPRDNSRSVGGISPQAAAFVLDAQVRSSETWLFVLVPAQGPYSEVLTGWARADEFSIEYYGFPTGSAVEATGDQARGSPTEITVYLGTAGASEIGTVPVGTQGEVLGQGFENQSAAIYNKDGLWYEVDFGSVSGFVSAVSIEPSTEN